MMGDNNDVKEVDGEDEFDDFPDTMELEAESKAVSSSNVGDPSVELNVEEIVAELEADMGASALRTIVITRASDWKSYSKNAGRRENSRNWTSSRPTRPSWRWPGQSNSSIT